MLEVDSKLEIPTKLIERIFAVREMCVEIELGRLRGFARLIRVETEKIHIYVKKAMVMFPDFVGI